jgi:hypothetical protein
MSMHCKGFKESDENRVRLRNHSGYHYCYTQAVKDKIREIIDNNQNDTEQARSEILDLAARLKAFLTEADRKRANEYRGVYSREPVGLDDVVCPRGEPTQEFQNALDDTASNQQSSGDGRMVRYEKGGWYRDN